MLTTIKFTIIGIFVALLFLNLYFRIKVLKFYKRLVQNRVQFEVSDVFNRKKLESDVIAKYPVHKEDIEGFVGHIRRSVFIAIILVLLITLMGVILHFLK